MPAEDQNLPPASFGNVCCSPLPLKFESKNRAGGERKNAVPTDRPNKEESQSGSIIKLTREDNSSFSLLLRMFK